MVYDGGITDKVNLYMYYDPASFACLYVSRTARYGCSYSWLKLKSTPTKSIANRTKQIMKTICLFGLVRLTEKNKHERLRKYLAFNIDSR